MMLRVTVELVPFGDEDAAERVGQMVIANDGAGDDEFANYAFALVDNTNGVDCGTLKDFYRKAGFWDLIVDCLIRGNYESNALVGKLIDKLDDKI
jgi:hypothetical protein